MNETELLKEISRKLSALIALQLREDEGMQESVARLARLGLSTGEIAEILGTTPGSVAVLKNRIKNKKK